MTACAAEDARLVRPPSRELKRFLIVMGLAALLYAAGVNGHWRFQRDSAVYMTLARSLVEGRGYVVQSEFHTMCPPGWPAMLAGMYAVFGAPERITDSFLALNVLVALLGLGCVAVFYLILRELPLPHHHRFAVFLLYAFSRTHYYYSQYLMTDVPFTLFALGAVYCGLRMLRAEGPRSWAWTGVCGLLTACATAVRAVGPVVAVALTAGLWLGRGSLRRFGSNLGKTAVICVLLGVVLAGWLSATRRAESGRADYFRGRLTGRAMLTMPVRGLGRVGEHLAGIGDAVCGTHVHWPTGLLLSALMVLGLARALRAREVAFSSYGVLCAAAVAAADWPLTARYLLPALPVLFYWLVLGAASLGAFMRRGGRPRTQERVRTLGRVCIILLVALNVARIGVLVAESRVPRLRREADRGRREDYAELAAWLRQNAAPGDLVMAYEHTTIHYFTRLKAVHLPPDTRGRGAAWTLKRMAGHHVDWLVRDARKERSVLALDAALAESPGLFELVLRTGDVDLFRVHRWRMRGP